MDINPDDNPFGDLAERSGGVTIRRPATEVLPDLAAGLAAAR